MKGNHTGLSGANSEGHTSKTHTHTHTLSLFNSLTHFSLSHTHTHYKSTHGNKQACTHTHTHTILQPYFPLLHDKPEVIWPDVTLTKGARLALNREIVEGPPCSMIHNTTHGECVFTGAFVISLLVFVCFCVVFLECGF